MTDVASDSAALSSAQWAKIRYYAARICWFLVAIEIGDTALQLYSDMERIKERMPDAATGWRYDLLHSLPVVLIILFAEIWTKKVWIRHQIKRAATPGGDSAAVGRHAPDASTIGDRTGGYADGAS